MRDVCQGDSLVHGQNIEGKRVRLDAREPSKDSALRGSRDAVARKSKPGMQVIVRGASAMSLWRQAALLESRELQAREERWYYGDMRHDELAPGCACNLLQHRRGSVSADYVPHLNREDASMLQAKWGLSLPVQAHAASASQNRSTSMLVTAGGPLPAGQLVFVEPGVWVVSPEMCLADLARRMELLDLLALAFELCGRFVRDAVGGAGHCELGRCAPRTTPQAVADLASQLEGFRGVRSLRFVARHVIAGSRSPRESGLAAALALPHAYGGYALPAPFLNYEVELSKEASCIWGRQTCELDGCWPEAKLAYEYQSSLHNASASRDAMKRMALEADGWRVISIGGGQISHEVQMDAVAKEIARCLDVRLDPRGKGYRAAQRKLFDSLIR